MSPILRSKRIRLPPIERLRVAALQKWRCADCESVLDEHYECDHRIPLCRGGTNQPTAPFFQALCCLCHRRKSLHETRAAVAVRSGCSTFFCPRCREVVSALMQHRCQEDVTPPIPKLKTPAPRSGTRPKPRKPRKHLKVTPTSSIIPFLTSSRRPDPTPPIDSLFDSLRYCPK